MKFFFTWGGWLAALIVLQASLGKYLEIASVKPDFFLISVIQVAMRGGAASATLWGLAAGFVQDVLSGGIVGFNVLTKPVAGFAVGILRAKMDFDNPNTQTLVALLVTLAEGTILAAMLQAYIPAKSMPFTVSRIVVPEAIYNGLVIPLLIPASRLLKLSYDAWRKPVRPAE